MRQVPFFNYPELYNEQRDVFIEQIDKTLSKGAFIMQQELLDFENNLADYLGCRHAIGVADGTAAIEMSLIAAGIQPGDEVIVSSHTFIATAAAVHHTGGVPVVADCLPDSMIDPASIRQMITPRTRIIMPTQLNGRVADMDQISAIADEFDLLIVEDSCQAMGARFQGKAAGLFGVAGSFSFYPAKTLGAFGDGGGVVTNDDEVAEKIRQIRDHGRRPTDGKVTMFGRNGRLDNVQAAILDLKLRSYDTMIARRRAIATMYQNRLGHIDSLTLPPAPESDPRRFDIFQNYEIQAERRDELRQHLADHGVGTILQWGGWMLHQFDDLAFRSDAQFAETFSQKFIMLPMHHLLTDEDVDHVCSCIEAFYS